MFLRNSIYLLPRDGALSVFISRDHDHVSKYKPYYQKGKLGWTGEKILLCIMPWPNIPGLAIVLNQTFSSPTSKQVLSSHRYQVRLHIHIIKDHMDCSKNLPSN